MCKPIFIKEGFGGISPFQRSLEFLGYKIINYIELLFFFIFLLFQKYGWLERFSEFDVFKY